MPLTWSCQTRATRRGTAPRGARATPPRTRIAAAAGEPGGGDGVVRGPERPLRDERPVALAARAVHLGHFDALLHRERRQDTGHPPREHGLARTRRTAHDHVVSSSRCHFQGALGVSLPGHVGEILRAAAFVPVFGARAPRAPSACRRRGNPRPPSGCACRKPRRHRSPPPREHPSRVARACCSPSFLAPSAMERAPLMPLTPPSSESSPTTPARSSPPGASAPEAARMPSAIGQVKGGTLLPEVGRGEVHDYALRRELVAAVGDRNPHPLPRLLNRRIGQANNGETRASQDSRLPPPLPAAHRSRTGSNSSPGTCSSAIVPECHTYFPVSPKSIPSIYGFRQ